MLNVGVDAGTTDYQGACCGQRSTRWGSGGAVLAPVLPLTRVQPGQSHQPLGSSFLSCKIRGRKRSSSFRLYHSVIAASWVNSLQWKLSGLTKVNAFVSTPKGLDSNSRSSFSAETNAFPRPNKTFKERIHTCFVLYCIFEHILLPNARLLSSC